MDEREDPILAQLFLATPRRGRDHRAAAERWARRVVSGPPAVSIRIGRRIPDPSETLLEERGLRFDHSIHVYIEIATSSKRVDEMLAALRDASAHLGPVAESRPSCIALGRLRTILEGSGPVVGLHWLARRADLVPEQFHDYWGGGHASKSRGLAGQLGYLQHHVDPWWTSEAARLSGLPGAEFDGVAITRSVDLPSHVRVMSGAGASRGMSDNASFVEVERSPYLTAWQLAPVWA